jgi:transposase-like protein
MECPICKGTKVRPVKIKGKDSVRCSDCGSSPDDESEAERRKG